MAQQGQPTIFNLFFGGNTNNGKQSSTIPQKQQHSPQKERATSIQLKPVDKSQDLISKVQTRVRQLDREIGCYEAQIQQLNNDAIMLTRSNQKQNALKKVDESKRLQADKRDKELIRNQLREEIRTVQRTQTAQDTYQLKKEAHEYKRSITTELDVVDIKEMSMNDITVNGEIDYIFNSITGIDAIDVEAENDENEAYLNDLMENMSYNNNNQEQKVIQNTTMTKNNVIDNMMQF